MKIIIDLHNDNSCDITINKVTTSYDEVYIEENIGYDEATYGNYGPARDVVENGKRSFILRANNKKDAPVLYGR